jgi:hypothetical protein
MTRRERGTLVSTLGRAVSRDEEHVRTLERAVSTDTLQGRGETRGQKR